MLWTNPLRCINRILSFIIGKNGNNSNVHSQGTVILPLTGILEHRWNWMFAEVDIATWINAQNAIMKIYTPMLMCVCIYRDQNDVNKINLFAYLVITFITMNRNSCFMYHVFPTKEHLLSLCKAQQSVCNMYNWWGEGVWSRTKMMAETLVTSCCLKELTICLKFCIVHFLLYPLLSQITTTNIEHTISLGKWILPPPCWFFFDTILRISLECNHHERQTS